MAKKIKDIHPGEILKTEFLEPLKISSYELAKRINVPSNRITRLVSGKTRVTAETDIMLAKAFGIEDGFFLRLQAEYDTRMARKNINVSFIKTFSRIAAASY